MPTQAQRQHVLFFRKKLLRQRMLRWALDGPAYIPFIGDGDLAVDLYADRPIFGADIDPKRVATAQSRLAANIVEADCNYWPFPGNKTQFAIGDFDAYSHPYPAFEAFWKHAEKLDRVLVFFTDGHRQAVLRLGIHVEPDGTTNYLKNVYQKQPIYNFYLTKYVWPWFEDYIGQGDDPYHVIHYNRYFRGLMAHWSAVLERTS